MWEKIKRYQEGLKNESNPDVKRDLKAIISGMTNFFVGSKKADEVAKDRLENSCSGCEFFKTDPIESERVEDKRIPQLSGKICGACGCTLSYKLRQSIKPCKHWK